MVAVCLDSTGNTQVYMEDGTDSFWVVTESVDEVVRKIENWNESTYDQDRVKEVMFEVEECIRGCSTVYLKKALNRLRDGEMIKLTTKSDKDIISALLQECLLYLYGEMIRRTGHEFDTDADAKLRDLIERIRAWIGEEK